MNLDRANTPAGEEHATVYVAFELSKAKWRLGIILPGASRGTSSGPLSIVSGSTGWYAEGDIGYGVSFSASIQGDRNGVSGVSVNPRPTVGVGYGVWAGFGGNGNVTLATPTFGQIYNSLASTFSTSSQPSATSGDNSAIGPVSTATVSTQNDAGGNIGLAGDSVGSAPNGSSPGK